MLVFNLLPAAPGDMPLLPPPCPRPALKQRVALHETGATRETRELKELKKREPESARKKT